MESSHTSIQIPDEGSQARRAIVHEVTLTLGGALLINSAWWCLVYLFGISFPLIHIALLVGTLYLLPHLDHKDYPTDPSTGIFAIRGCTNFVLFILGLVITGPFGGIYENQKYVPDGVVQFVLSWVALASLLGFVRAMIHFSWILVKHFK